MLKEDGEALLVTEIHHRVMNSYQVISALAHRCSRIREIEELPPVLDDLADRLTAFAAVHRQLAMPPSGSFDLYCSALGRNLVAAFGRSDTILVCMDVIDVPERRLASIAFIIAELLTNCLKHSLAAVVSGSIRLDLHISDGQLVIEAQDSAAGPVTDRNCNPSRVVSALSASLGGDAYVVDRQGYCAQVTVPVFAPATLVTSRRGGMAAGEASPALHPTTFRTTTATETVDVRP